MSPRRKRLPQFLTEKQLRECHVVALLVCSKVCHRRRRPPFDIRSPLSRTYWHFRRPIWSVFPARMTFAFFREVCSHIEVVVAFFVTKTSRGPNSTSSTLLVKCGTILYTCPHVPARARTVNLIYALFRRTRVTTSQLSFFFGSFGL